jgi:selenocysteine lyase/cysteine desulfurase
MYQHLYSEFFKRHPDLKHFAAHSHHFWPDVTRDAMLEYWEDAALHIDKKWNVILGEKIPELQSLIAKNLNFSRPQDIAFASNTHELLVRLLSCLDFKKRPQILTTDSEFYSFERQIRRLEEENLVEVHRVETQDLQNFEERFLQKLKSKEWDLVFISHVFFNSGVATRKIHELTSNLPQKTIFLLDGYHSFFALPVDLSTLGDQIYFMAGGYKYAQSGEGCCFLTLPKNCELRPRITGWFADMSGLENFQNGVNYSQDGYRFAGATMDYSAMYRMRAVLKLFNKNKITISQIHTHVQKQQLLFLEQLEQAHHPTLRVNKLVWRGDLNNHGHFLTFELGSPELCQKTYQELLNKKIMTDFRKTRLRFGFAMYHNGPYHFLNSL